MKRGEPGAARRVPARGKMEEGFLAYAGQICLYGGWILLRRLLMSRDVTWCPRWTMCRCADRSFVPEMQPFQGFSLLQTNHFQPHAGTYRLETRVKHVNATLQKRGIDSTAYTRTEEPSVIGVSENLDHLLVSLNILT